MISQTTLHSLQKENQSLLDHIDSLRRELKVSADELQKLVERNEAQENKWSVERKRYIAQIEDLKVKLTQQPDSVPFGLYRSAILLAREAKKKTTTSRRSAAPPRRSDTKYPAVPEFIFPAPVQPKHEDRSHHGEKQLSLRNPGVVEKSELTRTDEAHSAHVPTGIPSLPVARGQSSIGEEKDVSNSVFIPSGRENSAPTFGCESGKESGDLGNATTLQEKPVTKRAPLANAAALANSKLRAKARQKPVFKRVSFSVLPSTEGAENGPENIMDMPVPRKSGTTSPLGRSQPRVSKVRAAGGRRGLQNKIRKIRAPLGAVAKKVTAGMRASVPLRHI